MAGIAQKHKNIYYIEDPNAVNINPDITNSIAQYQDMHIFAELTAVRKGRSVVVIGEGIQKTGLENTLNVNFMGNNQNKNNTGTDDVNNPDYLKFTTNYYDGSTGDNQVQYESFGITSIKVVVNSSYIPQVNIQFIDVRGLSFFNQKDSPYRVLFDFPPPIFNLKIKGYYGKTLEYRLHLVKYTTEFKSENGNFIIDAQFVAVTFAPLSDVLFKYAINFPLIDDSVSMTPKQNSPPQNINELILKLKNLYSAGNTLLKTDIESKIYDNALTAYNDNQTTMTALFGFRDALVGKSLVFTNDVTSKQTPVITKLINVRDYDEYIKTLGKDTIPSTINVRLCIGYVGNPSNLESIYSGLTIYRTQLLTGTAVQAGTYGRILNTDISEPNTIHNTYNISLPTQKISDSTPLTPYYILDVTAFYFKLFQAKLQIEADKETAGKNMTEKINNMIEERLGMRPTIYNIFKIILDDVDKFFKVLRDTSKEAQKHHNKEDIKYIIANGGSMQDSGTNNIEENIFQFPLIIKKEDETCGQTEVRTSPAELNQLLPSVFPESKLIENFIDTFTKQRRIVLDYNMKDETDSDGTKRWIPISPIDSSLSGTDPSTPYGGLTNLDEIFGVLLDRFYILTQSSLPNDFYLNPKDATQAYVNLYAKAEALNLAMSLSNSKISQNLKTVADAYSSQGTFPDFYTYLEENIPATYAFPDGTIEVIGRSYIDKNNPNYIGANIYYDTIEVLTPKKEGGSPIDKFAEGVQRGVFKKLLDNRLPEESYLFTNDNVLYIKDTLVKKNTEKSNKLDSYESTPLETRYISSFKRVSEDIKKGKILFYEQSLVDLPTRFSDPFRTADKENFITVDLKNNGNQELNITVGTRALNLKNFQNIVDTWVGVLDAFDTVIYDQIISSGSTFGAAMLLSNFGYTLGPFNIFPNALNYSIFRTPSAIDVPKFLPAYIGALVDADTNGLREQFEEFFLTGNGKGMSVCGIYIFADIHDINTYLSENDKELFRIYFDTFMLDGTYEKIRNSLNRLYQVVQSGVTDGGKREKLYEAYLNPNTKNKSESGQFFNSILQPLMEETTIVSFTQNTFANYTSPTTYRSLKNINDAAISDGASNLDKDIKTVNDRFFRQLFKDLAHQITLDEDKQKEIEEENKRLKGDDDVMTQLYYSFKNINDKWLTGPEAESDGYPFNLPNRDLIDSFIFVDRAMNPVGNTCINPEILLALYEDNNASIFTVLSQLISENNFLFFPLQNFISHSPESWENTFKIDPSDVVEQRQAFVCLYVGGSSSYPNNLNNGFKDDGITDITTTDAADFDSNCPANPEYDKQEERNPELTKKIFRQVRAFRVLFGQQNQSMFTDIKIDSKEYPETNESIQILARLAGDEGKNAPIPKGQNLYNLYENRAYSATVTGLGNAMIQPTQYFQLDNVPLFNGAYLILSVEHNLVPNRMTTSFTGTKILKYPVPRVTNPAASMGFEGSSVAQALTGFAEEGTEASMITNERLNDLDSVLGVDVANYQGNINWSQAKEYGVDFAFIKVTEGTWFYDENSSNYELKQNIKNAINNKVKVGYYHFARPGSSTDPAADATAEANWFLEKVKELPKPDFPLVLDIENFIDDAYPTKMKPVAWTNRKASMPIYIQTFIDVLKDAGYKTIIYSYANFLNTNGVTNFNKYPLWLANYMNIRKNISPETHLPTPPVGWKSKSDSHIPWSAWQFSSQGKVTGINSNVDLNMMRKDFFNKYT